MKSQSYKNSYNFNEYSEYSLRVKLWNAIPSTINAHKPSLYKCLKISCDLIIIDM